jgi:hypothetical protein
MPLSQARLESLALLKQLAAERGMALPETATPAPEEVEAEAEAQPVDAEVAPVEQQVPAGPVEPTMAEAAPISADESSPEMMAELASAREKQKYASLMGGILTAFHDPTGRRSVEPTQRYWEQEGQKPMDLAQKRIAVLQAEREAKRQAELAAREDLYKRADDLRADKQLAAQIEANKLSREDRLADDTESKRRWEAEQEIRKSYLGLKEKKVAGKGGGGGGGGSGLSQKLKDDPEFASRLVAGDKDAMTEALRLSSGKAQQQATTGLIKTAGGENIRDPHKLEAEDRKKLDDYIETRTKAGVNTASNDIDDAIDIFTNKKYRKAAELYITNKDAGAALASVGVKAGSDEAKALSRGFQALGRIQSGYGRIVSGLVLPEQEVKRIQAQINGGGIGSVEQTVAGLRGIDETDQGQLARFQNPGAAAVELDRRLLASGARPSRAVRKASAGAKKSTAPQQPQGERRVNVTLMDGTLSSLPESQVEAARTAGKIK